MSKKNWTTEKLFTRLLNNKSKKSYWEYISILRSRPDKDVFFKCVELTTSDIPKNRIIGIDIFVYGQIKLHKRLGNFWHRFSN